MLVFGKLASGSTTTLCFYDVGVPSGLVRFLLLVFVATLPIVHSALFSFALCLIVSDSQQVIYNAGIDFVQKVEFFSSKIVRVYVGLHLSISNICALNSGLCAMASTSWSISLVGLSTPMKFSLRFGGLRANTSLSNLSAINRLMYVYVLLIDWIPACPIKCAVERSTSGIPFSMHAIAYHVALDFRKAYKLNLRMLIIFP